MDAHRQQVSTVVKKWFRDRFVSESILPDHPNFDDVLYCYAHACVLVDRQYINVPAIHLVPERVILKKKQSALPRDQYLFGTTLFYPEHNLAEIYLNRKRVDLSTVWGCSILVHEFIHVVQMFDGRYTEGLERLELEAEVFQKEFIEKHELTQSVV